MGTIFDWSATPASNTVIDGTNVAEGCPAGGVNNAIRSIAALVRNSFSSTLQTFLAGTSPLAIANGGTGGTTQAGALAALGITSTGSVPTGAVVAFAMNAAPASWLECNGAAVSRTTYAALFAAIGTTFGAGDGSTTFNLPQMRGEFPRGWDNGRGIDTGRAFGSFQAESIGPHNHSLTVAYSAFNTAWSGGGADSFGRGPSTLTTANNSGAETRPRNVAFLYCIKI